VGQRREDLFSFLTEEKDIVVKPTDGFGGSSVFRVRAEDTNAKVILETVTHRFSRDVILQKYLPESEKGDKRILLWDGEILGAVLRMHAPDDHRNNFFAGGKPFPAQITSRDREIVQTLKPKLQKLGLYLVGIDVIGEYLIEVNVTSPTGIQEMNRLGQQTLEDKVIEFAERLVQQGKT
jgi:glutathione synthase